MPPVLVELERKQGDSEWVGAWEQILITLSEEPGNDTVYYSVEFGLSPDFTEPRLFWADGSTFSFGNAPSFFDGSTTLLP